MDSFVSVWSLGLHEEFQQKEPDESASGRAPEQPAFPVSGVAGDAFKTMDCK